MIDIPIRDNQVSNLEIRKRFGFERDLSTCERIHVIGLDRYLVEYKDFVCEHDVTIKFENNGTANENGG